MVHHADIKFLQYFPAIVNLTMFDINLCGEATMKEELRTLANFIKLNF